MVNRYPVAILGANGYAGRELARLLLHHPHAQLVATLGRKTDWQLSEELPEAKAKQVKHYTMDELVHLAADLDTLFLATPAEISLEYIARLAAMNINIIDLSGALRLSAEDFAGAYGYTHPCPDLLNQVQYGLSPWLQHQNNDYIPSKLISNPGCYATCAQMSLLPLLLTHIIKTNSIIIDAKSGLTGAGRHAKENLLFCEMSQDFYPYKIGCHQHLPEIKTHLIQFHQAHTKQQEKSSPVIDLSGLILNTQVMPIKRGISMSIYTQFNEAALNKTPEQRSAHINAAFTSAYRNYALVKHVDLNHLPTSHHQKWLSLSHVVGSARMHIAWYQQQSQLILFATLDNLLKGAASQAIENFNWLHQLPCITALENLEGLL